MFNRTLLWSITKEARHFLSSEGIEVNSDGDIGDAADFAATCLSVCLSKGNIYWVAGDMSQLIGHVAHQLPDTSFILEDLPAKRGCVMLAEPISNVIGDIYGWCWRVLGDDEQVVLVALTINNARDVCVPIYITCLYPGLSPIANNASLGGDQAAGIATISTARAFWMLSQQQLAACHQQQPHRTIRRQLERSGRVVSDVTVVTLRRIHHGDGVSSETSSVSWSQRWLVSGHVRQQWMPKMGVHRSQWINAYVKGPEDKPLVLKERRYKLVR